MFKHTKRLIQLLIIMEEQRLIIQNEFSKGIFGMMYTISIKAENQI
jgi:hypothetical protein